MNTTCPHCSQSLEIDAPTLAALRGTSHFQCPTCAGNVPVPVPVPRPVAPHRAARSPLPQIGKKAASATLAQAHRGLNRNLLILGALALLTLGGLGIYLASRNGGNIFNKKQNITNQIIHNSYFQNLIALGKTTERDLQSLAIIRPNAGGFIGVSGETLPWKEGNELAGKMGAVILEPGPVDSADRETLTRWLKQTFNEHLAAPAWVQSGGQPRILDGAEVLAVEGIDRPRRILLAWNVAGPAGATPDGVGAPTNRSSDPRERKLAESVWAKGGVVVLREESQMKNYRQPEKLPEGSIEVCRIHTAWSPAVLDDEDARLMAGCAHLQELNLGQCTFTSLPFDSLPKLERLEMTSKMKAAAFERLPSCRKLKTIMVTGMPLDGAICRFASQIDSLEEIYLRNELLVPGDIKPLARLPHLRTLALAESAITENGILDGLEGMSNLTLLQLSVALPDADLNVLRSLRKLSTVYLPGAIISRAGWKNVAKLPELKTGGFRDSNITDEDLRSFSGHPKLTTLDLSETPVTAEGLGESTSFPAVAAITIFNNHLTDEGIKGIARSCPNLETLELQGKRLTARSAEALSSSRTLKALHFFDVPHFDEAWIPHLLKMKGLIDLALLSRFLTDAHVKALGGLKESLVVLDLRTSGITDACVDDLAGFKRLVRLDITDTKISDAGLQALRSKLPACNITR